MAKFEFDPRKNLANRTKHGLFLALASELDWEAALIWSDDLFEYGEERMSALAPGADDLYLRVICGPRRRTSSRYQPAVSQAPGGRALCP